MSLRFVFLFFLMGFLLKISFSGGQNNIRKSHLTLQIIQVYIISFNSFINI